MNSNTTYGKFLSKHYDFLYASKLNFAEGAQKAVSLFQSFGLTKNHTILDIGCGTGGHAFYVASLGCPILGIDISLDKTSEFTDLLAVIRDAYTKAVRARRKERHKKPIFIN